MQGTGNAHAPKGRCPRTGRGVIEFSAGLDYANGTETTSDEDSAIRQYCRRVPETANAHATRDRPGSGFWVVAFGAVIQWEDGGTGAAGDQQRPVSQQRSRVPVTDEAHAARNRTR